MGKKNTELILHTSLIKNIMYFFFRFFSTYIFKSRNLNDLSAYYYEFKINTLCKKSKNYFLINRIH